MASLKVGDLAWAAAWDGKQWFLVFGTLVSKSREGIEDFYFSLKLKMRGATGTIPVSATRLFRSKASAFRKVCSILEKELRKATQDAVRIIHTAERNLEKFRIKYQGSLPTP
jgi:hypothetical protein